MQIIHYNTITDSSLEKEMNPLLYKNKIESHYIYDGIPVPRVTNILSDMLHEEYLMNWANYMGRIKHTDHNKYTEEAADIGTKVHKAIEEYIKFGCDTDFSDIFDYNIKSSCANAFLSFKRWWSIIVQHDIKVIFQEQPLVCKYYGGTLDLFINIDGRNYLIDFKTSNHFNYKYHLQAAAYRRLLHYNYNIVTDGVIILRLSKKEIRFYEQVLDLSNYNSLIYMDECDKCFQSLVYAWYNRFIVTQAYSVFS